MKIAAVLEKILVSPNGCSREPIFETYDKNVQGNTVHERGSVAASIVAPFRDFPELPERESRMGVAIATGGNPFLAKLSARAAAEHAVAEAVVKVSCVGGTPLAVTDCLNFGNPERPEQMGQFVEGIAGLRTACEALEIPIVSGNVSFYNESGGRGIPPSTLVTVFARVDFVERVPQLHFQNPNETIFLIGPRSAALGSSALLEVSGKKDSRFPQIDFPVFQKWVEKLRHVAALNLISTAHPITWGGAIAAVAQSCFDKKIGAEIELQSSSAAADESQFLFSEDVGVIVATKHPEKFREIFGKEAVEIGKTTADFSLRVFSDKEEILHQPLAPWKEKWEAGLRAVL